MMNRLNITFAALFLLLGSTAHGDSVVKNITKEANNFIEQSLFTFLEGNGTTEIQFSGLEDKRPEFSIMLLRPIKEYEESVFFTQLQLNHYYVINDERFALNMGLGYRKLLDDNNYFIGANIFFDVDDEENTRGSIGLELRSNSFQANINWYGGLSSPRTTSGLGAIEKVLNGFDMHLLGQVPYFPWATIHYVNDYWQAKKNPRNTYGEKLYLEMLIHENVLIEAGFQDDNLSQQVELLNVKFFYPGKKGKSLFDGFISDTAFVEGDMKERLLDKVERTNRIKVESSNTSGVVIGRLD